MLPAFSALDFIASGGEVLKGIKAGATEKTLLRKFCVSVVHNVACVSKRGESKYSTSETQTLRLHHMLRGYAKRENIRETFKVSISSVFPKCFRLSTPHNIC